VSLFLILIFFRSVFEVSLGFKFLYHGLAVIRYDLGKHRVSAGRIG